MRITRVELARRLDVTETTLYRYENGQATISRMVELALKQIESVIKAEMAEQ